MLKSQFWNRWTNYVYLSITLFVLSFFIAALAYPGGSDVNSQDTVYRMHTNYWCELMGKYSKNGHQNKARPIGIAGMFSLCSGVILFWLKYPTLTKMSNTCKFITRIGGSASMFLAFFIFFYHWHDMLVTLSVIAGSFAFLCSLQYFRKQKNRLVYIFGLFTLILIYTNAFIYKSKWFIEALPMLQKVTFLATLSWISITIQTVKKIKN